MHGCNSPSLAVNRRDVLLHVDFVSSESELDELVMIICELVVLIVGELGTGSGFESSHGLVV